MTIPKQVAISYNKPYIIRSQIILKLSFWVSSLIIFSKVKVLACPNYLNK